MKIHYIKYSRFLVAFALLFQGCGSNNLPQNDAFQNDGSDGQTVPLVEWQSQTKTGSSPRDILDINVLKSLTLEDLSWKKLDQKTNTFGVTVISGTWVSGNFSAFNKEGSLQTIPLQQKAVVYFPSNYPDKTLLGNEMGVVIADHNALLLTDENRFYSLLAKELGVVVLSHGENEIDWLSLGFLGRTELVGQTYTTAMSLNACETKDFATGNFGLALAQTNIAAITLLTRLAEAEGGSISKVALRGDSKEGYAVWLASAVDDRIKVAGPGGYHLEDITGFDEYERQSGCDGKGPGDLSIIDLLTFRNWLKQSPAGQDYANVFMVSSFKNLLYPEFFLISGDTGMYNMHDGLFFRIGAETPFLESFIEKDWRYDRQAIKPLASGTYEDLQGKRLALLTARMILGSTGLPWPKITTASAEDNGTQIIISAKAENTQKVKLWINLSNNQQWNETDLDGDNVVDQIPWQSFDMTLEEETWVSDALKPAANMQVAWYVEAESVVEIKSFPIYANDSSPVQFLRLLDPLSCNKVLPINCQ